MPQNPGNQCRLLSAGENEGTVWPQAKKCPSEAVARAGNDPQLPTAMGAGLDVDGKDPLEALRPAHGGGWLVRIDLATESAWHNPGPVFEVRREYSMESREVQSGSGNQCSQAR